MMGSSRGISKEKQEGEEEINRLFRYQVSVPMNTSTPGFYPSTRRSTTYPSSESTFTPNRYPNPTFEETLFAQPPIDDIMSRLTISSNGNHFPGVDLEPPPLIDVFGNPISFNNDFYHMGMGGGGGGLHQHQPDEFHRMNMGYNQNNQSAIDYQRRIVYEDWLADQFIRTDCPSTSSQMNQGFDGSLQSRLNYNDSALHDYYLRLLNGVGGMPICACGNPSCPNVYPLRAQSDLALADQFIRGTSLSNGHRQQNYSGNRSRRGPSVGFNEWERSLSRSTLNNRNRMEQHQYAGMPLRECRRKILSMAHDQDGCRHLQTFFDDEKREEMLMIYSETKDHIGKLMTDPYGNYLAQKMFEKCNHEQLTQLIYTATRSQHEFVHIAMDMHGNCCVQKLLQVINSPEHIRPVMSALGSGTLMMTRETNGHYVLILCLKIFQNDEIKCILKTVVDHCVDIATDKSGCCILQHFLDYTGGDYKECLISEVAENSLLLAQDPYGNYVVQYLLQQRIPHVTEDILRKLKGNYLSLSVQKCSSNVVQRCLNESSEEQYVEIIRELIDSPKILMLFQDKYANYVIQTAMEVSKARERIFNVIADLIEVHYQSLRSHPFGKRVITRMNELRRDTSKMNGLSRRDRL